MNPIVERELAPDDLTWRVPAEFRDFRFDEVAPAEAIVGQDRAVAAIELGLQLRSPGYNIYVAGANGTGRTCAVSKLLEGMKTRHTPALRDRAYVHNFADPSNPRLLVFPAGQAREFKRELQRVVQHLREHIPSILEEESFRHERERIQADAVAAEKGMIGALEEKLKERGFVLIQLRAGNISVPEIVPVVKGHPVDWEEAERLVAQGKLKQETLDQWKQDSGPLHAEMETVFKKLRTLALEVSDKAHRLEMKAVEQLARALLGELRERYPIPKVHEYLDSVLADVLDNVDEFKRPAPRKNGGPDLSALLGHPGAEAPEDRWSRYEVNVVLDNSCRSGCPVVIEDSPSYANLLGSVEVEVLQRGAPKTDFTHIKAGSLLKADGGFLVVQALDLLVSPGAWSGLKRVLKTGRLEIRPSEILALWGTVALKPEPIDVDVKVIMIGEPYLYALLYHFEDDFKTIFKVKAEFDSEMPLQRDTLEHFLSVVTKLGKDEQLAPLDPEGALALVQEAVRRAGRRSKITTRFSEVGDLARESSHWARQEGAARVGPAHVRRAIREMERRNDLIDEKISELQRQDILHVEVAGGRIGQVNGLSVYDTGMYSFGKPARITATVAIGRAGIINIEREAGLSGSIHDKGVLILSGFLRGRYAQTYPLSLAAGLAFEQSYGGVEGDSASSTEVYALLSALAEVPIRQSVAVTGSVDQAGRIQAIGGVNQKIEGFFRLCRERGLTGDQGVMIPRANRDDLILREDVIEAVRAGKFHLWAIETIDEGIQILTGLPAGQRKSDGSYPEGTINARVDRKLRSFAETLAGFERGDR